MPIFPLVIDALYRAGLYLVPLLILLLGIYILIVAFRWMRGPAAFRKGDGDNLIEYAVFSVVICATFGMGDVLAAAQGVSWWQSILVVAAVCVCLTPFAFLQWTVWQRKAKQQGDRR